MWSKLVEELEPIGFVLATVHSEHERELARKVGVRELPHLVLLTDGKVSNYGIPLFAADFIRLAGICLGNTSLEIGETCEDEHRTQFRTESGLQTAGTA
jgi:hypothetical protein